MKDKILKIINEVDQKGNFYVFENREDLVESRTDWEHLKNIADEMYSALKEIKHLIEKESKK